MLRLVNLKKDYDVADTKIHALKDINLSFRKNEFVSVLGPSGCGKTTLLNIVGGLDRYTDGDFYINGISTKEFTDRSWDVYRNHRVGFVFQSYNLIPHQTILSNVELALTIAGISKKERVERAKAVLDKVGLEGQYKKRPNQLSGGQCQRVAIARALVNDPEILLADEPTGALDSTTSVQIMELIREIANERLVIMVTHNPDLAEEYSTRIVRLFDGELQSDTAPFSTEDEIAECTALKAVQDEKDAAEKEANIASAEAALSKNPESKKLQARLEKAKTETKKKETAKMSLFTAFRLSLQNLFTKKTRTIMTAFAGSIGIIGISMVLSFSYGVQSYIKDMQNDMLSGNPITVTESGFDISAMMSMMSTAEKREILESIDGKANIQKLVEGMVKRGSMMESIMLTNDITEDYIKFVNDLPVEDAVVFLDYGLDIKNNFYTDFNLTIGDPEPQNMSLAALESVYAGVLSQTDFAQYSSMISMVSSTFSQIPNSEEYILEQYDLLEGGFATKENELMLVLSEDNEIADLQLAQLGFLSQEEFLNIVWAATAKYSGNPPYWEYQPDLITERIDYSALMGKTFSWYPNNTVFTRNTSDPTNPFLYSPYSDSFSDSEKGGAVNMKIAGILRPKPSVAFGSVVSGFYYTEALTKKIIASSVDSEIVKFLKNMDYDAPAEVTGADGYIQPPPQAGYAAIMSNAFATGGGIPYSVKYIYKNKDTHESEVFYHPANVITASAMASMLATIAPEMATLFGDPYVTTLRGLGGIDIANSISIYPINFEQKNKVTDYLNRWNQEGDITLSNGEVIKWKLTPNIYGDDGEGNQIITKKATYRSEVKYSDPIELIISLINSMVKMITIALVSFTALSLVVSTVMIGIITYVSVVERVKEIGVIRALGGRKLDVSNLFSAETFIVGLASGLVGIVVTYILSAIVSAIVSYFAAIPQIAIFPVSYAVTMVAVSVGLTLISGFIPARSAAKKDPVVALRTE
ncbi:MAG: ABC transporter ATP-binding protein/permease [Christensenellaceae bacterium]|jgi:putative ABC transport system permease protein|nr:ABC transporter ATP-binding protein/permease [Christensenellaceae bacterium]